MRESSERGSATVFVLGLVAVGSMLLVALGLLIAAQASRGAAQSAADLAALAAADAAQAEFLGFSGPAGRSGSEFGESGRAGPDPCHVAGLVAIRNRARLELCAVGPGGVVDVRLARTASLARLHVGRAKADARAGPEWMRDVLASPRVS